MITHYDLFAGIGGFSLALEEVFDEPIRHIFCEWEAFPTQVLYKHWPQGQFYGDIAELIKCLESAQCVNSPMCSHRLKKSESGGVVTVHPAKQSTTKSGEKRIEKSTSKPEENGTKQADLKLSNITEENVPVVESQSQLSLLSTTSKVTEMPIEKQTAQEAGILPQERVIPTSSNSSVTTATWQNHGSRSAHIKENQNETEADIAELVKYTNKQYVASRRKRKDGKPEKTRQKTVISRGYDKHLVIVTGGFPCQPFSAAGRRRGTSDDRYKWPEMFEVIRNVQPQWVIAENVRGLVNWSDGLVLEQVCADLESEGYEVQPLIIPAVAVNAPHRRDRVWIIANRPSDRRPGRSPGIEAEERHAEGYEQAGKLAGRPERPHRDVTDIGRERRKQRGQQDIQSQIQETSRTYDGFGGWGRDWPEVAAELCGVFNGLSRELDTIMNDGLLLEYGKTFSRITGQDLPCLWEGFQSEEFQWSVGRFNTIQNKDYLFTVLWKLSKPTKAQNKLPFESKEVQEALLRNVWWNGKSGRTSQGWEYNEQYAEEHQDSLSQLSHEVALATAEIHKRYLLNRKDRLKALGNAIVPQVAMEIFRAIKAQLASEGKSE